MIIQSPGEIAFYIFNFPVYSYGIILAFAVFLGVCTAEILAKKFSDIPENFFVDNSPAVIIAGILGARLYYCIVNYPYYIHNPLEIFDIRQGGLSIHGMLIAGIITFYFLAKKYRVNLLRLLDVLACSVILAQSAGRWGNFFNSEAFGYPTGGNWGVFIPVSQRPVEFLNYEFFHPAFLYESFLDLAIFAVLIFILRRTRAGCTFFWYLILYSVVRIFVEYFRIDSVLNIGGFPIAQVVSVLLIIAGVIGLKTVNCKRY